MVGVANTVLPRFRRSIISGPNTLSWRLPLHALRPCELRSYATPSTDPHFFSLENGGGGRIMTWSPPKRVWQTEELALTRLHSTWQTPPILGRYRPPSTQPIPPILGHYGPQSTWRIPPILGHYRRHLRDGSHQYWAITDRHPWDRSFANIGPLPPAIYVAEPTNIGPLPTTIYVTDPANIGPLQIINRARYDLLTTHTIYWLLWPRFLRKPTLRTLPYWRFGIPVPCSTQAWTFNRSSFLAFLEYSGTNAIMWDSASPRTHDTHSDLPCSARSPHYCPTVDITLQEILVFTSPLLLRLLLAARTWYVPPTSRVFDPEFPGTTRGQPDMALLHLILRGCISSARSMLIYQRSCFPCSRHPLGHGTHSSPSLRDISILPFLLTNRGGGWGG